MRDSLTVLAILLIVLLTAALVAPYFIDWNSHRAVIEAKLSKAAGTRIAIAGPIHVRLLPQPVFRLGEVTIGEPGPGKQSLTVGEIDVDIALTALLRGDLQVGETVLRSPQLDLSAAANGELKLPIPALGDPARVQFQHIVVTDGTLTMAQPGRETLTLPGLDFEGEAASLIGPFKATGRFGAPDDRHPFRLSTGAFDGGKLRLKLGLDATKSLPAIELDGVVAPGSGGKQGGTGPSLQGLLTLTGNIPVADNPATIPWVLTGRVQATRDQGTATDLEFRAGTDMRAVIATGTGDAVLGAKPSAKLRLHGPQVNLDLLAVAPEKSTVPPPKGLGLLSRLNGLLSDPHAFAPPLALDVDYGFDTATAGSLTLLGIAGQVGLDGRKPARVRFTANGPDAARLALDGSLEAGPAPVFRGHVEASVRDLPRFADWLAPALPGPADWAKTAIPARGMSFAGTVDLSAVGIAARDATLQLDRTKVGGTLSYTRAVGGDRARLFADLASDALDLDALPDVGATPLDVSDVDLDVALSARAVKVVPAGIGAVDAGHLDLRLHKTGDSAVLDQFSAELGSARLSATGSLDVRSAAITVHVDAPQLDAVTGLLARLMPGRLTGLLQARAAAFSPARLDLGLKAARAGDGTLMPTALLVDGVANGSRVKADLKPDDPGDLDPATALVSLDLDADAPQALTLMRQFGLPVAASSSAPSAIGQGRLKGKGHGSLAEGFETSLDASIGNVVLSFQGRMKPELGNGHLRLKGGDLVPLLRSIGLAAAPEGETWPAEAEADLSWHDINLAFRHIGGRFDDIALSGDLNADLSAPVAGQTAKPALFGALTLDRLSAAALFGVAFGSTPPGTGQEIWSKQAFAPPPLQLPRAEIALKIGALKLLEPVTARDASLTLRTDRSAVTLADFTGKLDQGSLGGSLTLRRDGANASVSGTASWGNVTIDWPGLAGRVGGTLDLGGTGNTPAQLVASLAGTGSITIAGGRIAGLDPGAIGRTAVAAEKNTSEVDADQVRDMVVPELDRAPLPLGDVAGQATLAGGIFRFGPLRAGGGDWTADADTSIDIKTLAFASKTVLRVRQPLPGWKGEPPQVTLTLRGPISAPEREVDAAAFVNVLQSRAIARDQERIDILQQDIRERAYFNRRLKAIEADQAAAREKARAEADANRAATEVLRQMRQNQDEGQKPPEVPPPRIAPAANAGAAATDGSRPARQGSPSRPTVLPGARAPASGAATKGNRLPGARPAPPIPQVFQQLPSQAGSADPSSAGRY